MSAQLRGDCKNHDLEDIYKRKKKKEKENGGVSEETNMTSRTPDNPTLGNYALCFFPFKVGTYG